MRVIVLINSKAGSLATSPDLARSEHIREAFAARQIEADVRAVEGHQLAQAAREAIAAKPDAVVGGGGDGTISAVAGAIANSNIPMGVLPLGTLNHFAKDLRLPMNLEGAVKVIAAGHVESIDIARVNDRYFINNSSIGIYPQVVREDEELRQRLGRGKWFAMLLATIDAMRRFPVLTVRIGIGEKSVLRQTPFVFVGNNRYGMNLMSVRGRELLN